MMWKEFEEIAGYEVSYETYSKIIEPMYMALPNNIDKFQFVKMLDKKAFALPTKKEMVKEMKKLAQFIFENCGVASFHEEEEQLRKLAVKYAKRFYGIDVAYDASAYVYTNTGYAYCGCVMNRGCSFPKEIVMGKRNTDLERIQLVKA